MEYLGPYTVGPNDTEENGIYVGDARELSASIPDESVDLIFTDPPYIGNVVHLYEWLGGFASRVLKPNSALLCFFGIGFLDKVLDALKSGGLSYRWLFTVKWVGRPVFYGRIATHAQRCLWLEKGHSVPNSMVKDIWLVSQSSQSRSRYYVKSDSNWNSGSAEWGKDIEVVSIWTAGFIGTKKIVLDPFCGFGTMQAACKMTGNYWLGFDISESAVVSARRRVSNTPVPLFTCIPEQMEFGKALA